MSPFRFITSRTEPKKKSIEELSRENLQNRKSSWEVGLFQTKGVGKKLLAFLVDAEDGWMLRFEPCLKK